MTTNERVFCLLFILIFSPVFIMGYNNIPEPVLCDEYLNTHWGIISSPNYPFNYSAGRSCLQRIYFEGFTSQNPKKICFTFYTFQLAFDRDCLNDYLEFPAFEGSFGLVRYCGNGIANRNYTNETRVNVFSPKFCWTLESGQPFDLRFRSLSTSPNQGYFAEYEVRDVTDDDRLLSQQCTKLSPICHPLLCAKTEFKCRNGVCIARELVCDGKSDCTDSSDEGYWHARCPVNASIESCSFEDDLCQFYGEGIVRNSSSPVGPKFDHTYLTISTGNFVYFDGNALSYLDYEATPVVRTEDHCFSFWFYMTCYVGTLSLYITDATGRQTLAWFRQENRGLVWHRAEIDLPAKSFPLQKMRFEATEGLGSNNIAIDDLSFLQGTCYKSDISCTFELGPCGWRTIVSSENHIPWVISYDDDALSTQQTQWAKQQSSTHVMLMNLSGCDGGKTARLISRPVVDNVFSSSYYCLRFSYLLPVNGIGSLSVSVINYLGASTGVWQSGKNAASAKWKYVTVSITSTFEPFQIAFDGTCTTAYYSGVAIDNIELAPGFCSRYVLPRTAPPFSVPSSLRPSWCSVDQYRCAFTSECIFRDRVCDGKADCGDRTDETDCAKTGGELLPYSNQQFLANDVIIGVSVVCVAIFLTVVIVIVVAARRRSILLRIARVRMMRRCTDSVINDHFESFPAFMEPKPPPYDFSPPIAPSYALSPPPYTSQSSDCDFPDGNVPPPYEMERFVAEQTRGCPGSNGQTERQILNVDADSADEQNARRMRTTSI